MIVFFFHGWSNFPIFRNALIITKTYISEENNYNWNGFLLFFALSLPHISLLFFVCGFFFGRGGGGGTFHCWRPSGDLYWFIFIHIRDPKHKTKGRPATIGCTDIEIEKTQHRDRERTHWNRASSGLLCARTMEGIHQVTTGVDIEAGL